MTGDELCRAIKDYEPVEALYGSLWSRGEVAILFADTNVGKSIMAMQIAHAITQGRERFIPDIDVPAECARVLLLDCELSTRQFYNRYRRDDGTCYPFGEWLIRLSLGGDACDEAAAAKAGVTFTEMILRDIETYVRESGVRAVIVDNISFLYQGTEVTADALELMRRLLELKRRYDLSILVLAHTPKRSRTCPITINDMQGSKMLANLADSVFAMGASAVDSSLRYIKQLKQRNTEQQYGSDHVIVCRLCRDSDKVRGMLHFEFERYDYECRHLLGRRTDGEGLYVPVTARHSEIRAMHTDEGLSAREIAERTGMSVSQIYKIIK